MGAEIRGVELSENSLNSLLIDDLFSHYILTMRRSYCGALRVNCVIKYANHRLLDSGLHTLFCYHLSAACFCVSG